MTVFPPQGQVGKLFQKAKIDRLQMTDLPIEVDRRIEFMNLEQTRGTLPALLVVAETLGNQQRN